MVYGQEKNLPDITAAFVVADAPMRSLAGGVMP
jgi:hypothetical protein